MGLPIIKKANEVNRVKLVTLTCGDTFIYNDTLYMKTNEDKRNTICLESGNISDWSESTLVEPVQITIEY